MLRALHLSSLSKFTAAHHWLTFAAHSLCTSTDSSHHSLDRQPRDLKRRRTAKQQQQQQQHSRHSQQQQPEQQDQERRRLVVAVVGLPNAGKSTLTNRLIGHKISGVSSKRNTTIDPQLGSFNVGNTQVLLYDTPGLVDQPGQGNPAERLRSAWSTAAMADQLLLIVDADRQFRLQEAALLKLVGQVAAGPPQSLSASWQAPPALLFLNKQDKLEPNLRATVLQQLRQQLCGLLPFQAVFEGAAMRGEAVQELKDYLVQQARPGAWLMPPGQSHAASPGELAVELVREKLYRRLNQELPYRITVTQEAVMPLRTRPEPPSQQAAAAAATTAVDGSQPQGDLAAGPAAPPPAAAAAGRPPDPRGLYIRIGVGVGSKMVKSIVVGKGGEVIQKYVAEPTQAELARILKRPVKLVVAVKVLS